MAPGTRVAISRDGTAVAWLGQPGTPWSIYVRRLDRIWSLEEGVWLRLTFEPGIDNYPVWSADGRAILYCAGPMGQTRILRRAADGTRRSRLRLSSGSAGAPLAVLPC